MKHSAALMVAAWMSVAWFSAGARADEARPDFVVVAHGDASQSVELLALAEAIATELRSRGQSLLLQPVAAFEMLHSRETRRLDLTQLRTLGEALFHATTVEKDPIRLTDLAHAISDAVIRAPEARVDEAGAVQESARYIVTQACFEGIHAYDQLGKLPAARKLIDRCASLTWLVASDRLVRPETGAPGRA